MGFWSRVRGGRRRLRRRFRCCNTCVCWVAELFTFSLRLLRFRIRIFFIRTFSFFFVQNRGDLESVSMRHYFHAGCSF
ncbi:Hypothetical predicted protein [Cloeon dipterum]|uniref:Uncharacterized protein n=1 Tax=Cloeon dipterum TaxID=197152 RepID=A0A8S1DWM0_9INSE|nr:Hypothetical predicted protein [Cloeon dipterum]